MFGKYGCDGLHDPVREIPRQYRKAGTKGVEPAFQRKHERKPASTEIPNSEEHVFTVLFGYAEGVTMQILAFDRKRFEICKDMAADGGELGWIVAANIENTLAIFLRKSIQSHRKDHNLARTSR